MRALAFLLLREELHEEGKEVPKYIGCWKYNPNLGSLFTMGFLQLSAQLFVICSFSSSSYVGSYKGSLNPATIQSLFRGTYISDGVICIEHEQ